MISLEEAKNVLRVDGTDNDSIISAIVESLPALIETQTGLSELRQRDNKVVKQLEGLYLRQLYFGVDDTKLERAIDSLLKIVSVMSVEGVDYVDKVITENGVYLAADEGADGFSSVSVEVPNPALMSRSITQNGTYCCQDETAGAAYGYDTVVVDVKPKVEPLLVTSAGEYSANLSGLDGYDKVVVDVKAEAIVDALDARVNGLYSAKDSGLDGWDVVHVNVPTDKTELEPLAVTQNGTYTPEGGKGFGTVSVNVPTESGGGGVSEWELKYIDLVDGGFTKAYLPDGLSKIRAYAFWRSPSDSFVDVGQLVIPETVSSIGVGAFYYNKEYSGRLVLPAGLTSIGKECFYQCVNFIGDLELPVGVTELATGTFQYCSGLENFVIRRTDSLVTLGSKYGINGTKFTTANSGCYIYVPDELVDSYKAATNWTTYAAYIKPLSEYAGGSA